MTSNITSARNFTLAFLISFFATTTFAQICIPPVLSLQPVSNTICVGNVSTFAVVSVGLNLSYQWQVDEGSGYHNCSNGSTYSGALTATLSVSASASLNANHYRCVVSNPCGSVTSNICLLTVPNISVGASQTT